MTRPGPHCIATITGRVVDLAAPTPDMIDIEDIAHALSLLCRYNGHVEYHYSVAQHSCLVHDEFAGLEPSGQWALWALLHDAHEAYTGDIPTPLKRLLSRAVDVESMLDVAIKRAFDCVLPWPDSKCRNEDVKTADLFLYAWERRDVAHVPGIWDVPADLELPEQKIIPWPAAQAKAEFLERFGRYR